MPKSCDRLTWGNLCLDLHSGRVRVGEQIIALTATEYHLLELFLRHPDRIFSRSAILDRLWDFDQSPSDRAVVTHVKDLRKKLKAGGLTEDLLETIYGMGYRLLPAPLLSRSIDQPPATTSQTAIDSTLPQSIPNMSRINQVIERFRGVFHQQVAVLEQAKVAILAGNLPPELQQSAQQTAHKLAGSLATFGYPAGSKLARSIEHLFRDTDAATGSFTIAQIAQYAEQVTALQQTLAQPPLTSPFLLTQSSSSIAPEAQSYQVLVIDDDVALTEALKAESALRGMPMQVASSLAEARSHLAVSTPAVILLDLSFPDPSNSSPEHLNQDGLSLLAELAERSPNLPVIIFTGRNSLSDRLAVARLGARQFLHKSATPAQIFRAIEQVVAIAAVSASPSAQPAAKVLIIDDDVALLAQLSSMLTPWGLAVVTLNDPQQFWQVLVATAPDLVLLDLEMPAVNGLDLCQIVRQDTQWGDLPLLVITAHTEAAMIQRAFAAGADDFIRKPILEPELVTRILSRLERTRSQRSSAE